METNAYIDQDEYIKIFRAFPRKKKILIAEEINKELFEELWAKVDSELPDISGLEDLIIEEVKAVRYGN